MANSKVSYPIIAEQNWWKLRNLFKQKVPSAVTSTYLANALSMTTDSAKANILGPFKKIGIIDGTGKPTDLAYEWRDDDKYKTVCKKLLESIYPQELKDLFSSSESVDYQRITKWFMNCTRCGQPAGKKYANFYILLLIANPKNAITEKKEYSKKIKVAVNKKSSNVVDKATTIKKEMKKQKQNNSEIKTDNEQTFSGSFPELHINIQLHISPESTLEQIDKIFESMAKHLKRLKT